MRSHAAWVWEHLKSKNWGLCIFTFWSLDVAKKQIQYSDNYVEILKQLLKVSVSNLLVWIFNWTKKLVVQRLKERRSLWKEMFGLFWGGSALSNALELKSLRLIVLKENMYNLMPIQILSFYKDLIGLLVKKQFYY